MNIVITGEELEAMSGLPHIQQLTYIRGIRPYMDAKTGLTGIKRRISYQSISEQLYIEPHQGIKSQTFSRDQIRRSISGLERVGVIAIQSEGRQLILKCLLASGAFSIQNKAAINPPQKDATTPHVKDQVNSELSPLSTKKATTPETPKAAIPQKENNYIYLLQCFESFWLKYPEKKSRDRALEMFQQINPDESLLKTMLKALDDQIHNRNHKQANGEWVPAWKYPANWLAQKCWEDEIKIERTQEKRNATCGAKTERKIDDPFWCPEFTDDIESITAEFEPANVINLHSYRQR